jgi:hypothetical protein
LFFDWKALEGSKNEERYRSQNYWRTLNRENFKYHRKQLNILIAESDASAKREISLLIENMFDLLI